VAEPVLDADSRAKVQMRREVRGLRTIEREVLAERRPSEQPPLREAPREETQADVVQVDAAARRWCWIIVPQYAASSTTIKGGLCIHRVSAWPRL